MTDLSAATTIKKNKQGKKGSLLAIEREKMNGAVENKILRNYSELIVSKDEEK